MLRFLCASDGGGGPAAIAALAEAERRLNRSLNPSQQRAAAAAATSALTLVQGPPGTGKTAVALAVLIAWVVSGSMGGAPATSPPLEPPPGTGWRGSTLGTDKLELGGTFSDEQDPEEYARKYGYPLHILRVFKGRGNAQLNDAQLDWVKNKGGIIFYSVYKTYNDWANVGDPAYDWAIDAYVAQFKAVAPAKMWICLRFEPGLYTNAAGVIGERLYARWLPAPSTPFARRRTLRTTRKSRPAFLAN